MIRIGMLSFAHVHAEGYAQQVESSKEAEIAVVWDDDEERGRTAAERHGVPFTTDLEAVLGDEKIEAVVLNAETSKHRDLILAAVKAEKHLFTEKTLTITTAEAEEVVPAVKASGIKFMISLPSRSRPEILFAKRMLDEGLLGQVTMMRSRIAHCAALDRWFSGGSAWFGDAALAGGGALFDLGCHTVDVMRWFLGEPASAVAKMNNFSGAYDIDDNCVLVVEFKNKAIGILDVAFVHRAGPNTMEIYGTEGFLANGLPGQPLTLISNKLKAGEVEGWITPTKLPQALPTPMQQWLGAIARDEPMHITVDDGRNLTQLLEAAYVSAREGREVRF